MAVFKVWNVFKTNINPQKYALNFEVLFFALILDNYYFRKLYKFLKTLLWANAT